MADDFSGWKTALNSTLIKMQAQNGPLYGKSADADLVRAFIVLLRAECVAAGLTGL